MLEAEHFFLSLIANILLSKNLILELIYKLIFQIENLFCPTSQDSVSREPDMVNIIQNILL